MSIPSKTKRPGTRRGVAMFVVLASIVLFAMLGFIGLSLAQRDTLSSGDLVQIKSQRVAAVSGFNLAISRMKSNPTNTVSLLTAFKAAPTSSWLVFDDASKAVTVSSTEPQWYSLDNGQSAVRVRLLGISADATNGVRIFLESFGRGKDGNIHSARGLYSIRGLDFEVGPTTNGPSNAFQAQGGIDQFHIGATVDGSVYSGNPSAIMNIENGSGTTRNLKSLRIAGSLRLTQGLVVDENSIVGGTLNGNGTDTSTVFKGNLLVRGGLILDNPMVVQKSFYLSGCPKDGSGNCTKNQINSGRTLAVWEIFKVDDQPLYVGSGSAIEVGLTTKAGTAYLANGVELQGGTGRATINGDLYLGTGTSNDDVGGTMSVTGNLNYFGTGVFRVSGSADIDGNASFAGPVRTGSSNTGTLNIDGKGQFMAGIQSAGSSSTPSISIGSRTYISASSAAPQANTAQSVVFGDVLSLNGSLASTFQSGTTWSFKSTATTKTWSYNSTGLATANKPAQTTVANATSLTERTTNEAAPTDWVTSHTAVTLPAALSTAPQPNLGYTAEELDLSLAGNPSTDIMINAFPSSFRAKINWSTIRTKYRNGTWTLPTGCTVADLGEYGKLPTAAGINCIYSHQKALGTSGILWNGEYLVIIQDGLDPNAQWNSQSATGTADPGELAAGVKVFFLVTGGLNTNSIGFWYSNPAAGSVQILYSSINMEHFMWKSTYQGFIYFNLPDGANAWDITAFGGGPKLIGSWENVNPNRRVKFDLSYGKAMTIEYSTATAKGIFSDIANNFTNQTTLANNGVTQTKSSSSTELQAIILFSGDKKSGTPGGGGGLKVYDGWIQFDRLGEFR